MGAAQLAFLAHVGHQAHVHTDGPAGLAILIGLGVLLVVEFVRSRR
jgi:hypothetical protein